MTAPQGRLAVAASVAVEWLVPEEGSITAEALFAHDLQAPNLLRIEVGKFLRTLSTRGALTDGQAREAFELLLDASVTWHEPDPELLRTSLDITMTLTHRSMTASTLLLRSGSGRLPSQPTVGSTEPCRGRQI